MQGRVCVGFPVHQFEFVLKFSKSYCIYIDIELYVVLCVTCLLLSEALRHQ